MKVTTLVPDVVLNVPKRVISVLAVGTTANVPVAVADVDVTTSVLDEVMKVPNRVVPMLTAGTLPEEPEVKGLPSDLVAVTEVSELVPSVGLGPSVVETADEPGDTVSPELMLVGVISASKASVVSVGVADV